VPVLKVLGTLLPVGGAVADKRISGTSPVSNTALQPCLAFAGAMAMRSAR
jgi:hypothetical protein